jgi:predicted ABC-type ATPase
MTGVSTITMIAGCNGSGKTTLAQTLLPEFLHVHVLVNPDEIARGLNPLDPTSMQMKAGRIALEQMDEYIKAGKSFAFETTASGLTHKKRLQAARKRGFRINLIYLYVTDPKLAVLRVKIRTQQGGHHVPAVDIKRRYQRGIYHVLHDYLPLADQASFYLNDGQLIKQPFARKTLDQLAVYDGEVWSKLQSKGKKYCEKITD